MIDKDKLKELISDLIITHNLMSNNFNFRSDIMQHISHSAILHLLECYEDAGYISEEELDKYCDQVNYWT